jgi:hypothetical protein
MTSLKYFAAALFVSSAFATPAFAQAAIQEPGAYAFYHPNADVLNASRPADAMASQIGRGDDTGTLRMSVRPHRAHRNSSARAY